MLPNRHAELNSLPYLLILRLQEKADVDFGVKDNTIAALLERDRETIHLIAGLQRMLTSLLGRSEPTPPDTH
jgi:hypothetical protein